MVISFNDFNSLSEQEKKETLQDLKKQIGVSGIVNAWAISRSKAYNILNELNIPLNPKGNKTSKTKTVSSSKNVKQDILDDRRLEVSAAAPKKNGKQKNTKKQVEPKSSLVFDHEENVSKFSLHLETQGNGSLISETLQMLLAANKLSNANLQVNITLLEM